MRHCFQVVYLRTDLADMTDPEIWKTYMMLNRVENAFRRTGTANPLSFKPLQQTGTGAHDDLPLLGDLGHASRQKVRRRKMSSDHKSVLAHAAQAFANQLGEVG
jgi:hypothetical protein